MPTATQPDLQPLVAAQGQIRASLTDQAAAIAALAAEQFNGWYDSGQVNDWANRLSMAIQPLLNLLARNTDAYLAQAITDLGHRFRPAGSISIAGDLRNGVTQRQAYARVAGAYRWQTAKLDNTARLLATTDSQVPPILVLPMQAAVERAQDVTDLNTQLVVRQQAQRTLTAAQGKGLVTGWRRIIHSELSKSGTCGLCIAASDRVYKVSELQPIHRLCHCIPAPIQRGKDPGGSLNRADLDRLYKDAGSTRAADLKRTRYRVDEHGELGPVLTEAGSPRVAATASARRADTPRPRKPPEVLRADLTRTLSDLQAALPKAAENATSDPKKWAGYQDWLHGRISSLEQELRGLAA